MVKKITADGLTLEYVFERKSIKNINIRIRRDGSIYVSAPSGASFDAVEELVASKAEYLASVSDKIKNSLPDFSDGGRIYHLGKAYTIRYVQGTSVKVFTDNAAIYAASEAAFHKWEKERATEIITAACEKTYPLFRNFCPLFPTLCFRKMTAKWGICRPSENRITFNTALVRTSPECIDYVICHEFMHFLHPNHSARFYNALSAAMPDWKERKKLLSTFKI